jgi:hypothetical protein
MSIRCRGKVFTEPFPSSERLFFLTKLCCLTANVVSFFVSQSLPRNGSICHTALSLRPFVLPPLYVGIRVGHKTSPSTATFNDLLCLSYRPSFFSLGLCMWCLSLVRLPSSSSVFTAPYLGRFSRAVPWHDATRPRSITIIFLRLVGAKVPRVVSAPTSMALTPFAVSFFVSEGTDPSAMSIPSFYVV